MYYKAWPLVSENNQGSDQLDLALLMIDQTLKSHDLIISTHPLEGSRVAITFVIFEGKNYDLWQKAVRIALKSKNKLGIIERTITTPSLKGDDAAKYNAWEMVNSMICSWIINVKHYLCQNSSSHVRKFTKEVCGG